MKRGEKVSYQGTLSPLITLNITIKTQTGSPSLSAIIHVILYTFTLTLLTFCLPFLLMEGDVNCLWKGGRCGYVYVSFWCTDMTL